MYKISEPQLCNISDLDYEALTKKTGKSEPVCLNSSETGLLKEE